MQTGSFTTSDGATLNYLSDGTGTPVVMIPGWSQTAAQFSAQIDGLKDSYHCIAIDMRGHGDSANVEYGYKIYRLALDVHEFLVAHDLHEVTLMGHSMGCSIIWSYWDMFGADRTSQLVLIDQSPMLTGNPAWSEEETQQYGVVFTSEAVHNLVNGLYSDTSDQVVAGLIGGMFTAQAPDEMKQYVLERNQKIPGKLAADLLYNHCHQDWRDLIPRINIPTLIVSGRVSFIPWQSQQWIHEQIAESQVVYFEEDEGGQHFMFIENPTKFNQTVRDFLQTL